MKYPKYIAAILSVFVVLLTGACKKGSMINLGTVKIASVYKIESTGGRHHYYIGYDRFNNVDSIGIIGGGTDTGFADYVTFSYVGSSFVINDHQNGSVMVDANTNGQIIKVLSTDTLIMFYNGSELTEIERKLASINPPGYALDSTVYTWNGGDLIGYKVDTGVVDSYYYDLTRTGQIGDALSIENFLTYGRSYFTTVHLQDELSFRGVWVEEDLYQFDGQGRISELMRVINGTTNGTSSPNDTTTYLYTYY